ncbi:MAG TPA: META domain-containing protein [Flavitalea sp.]|nr:META domain-containing protein [Flavitalea sp.]
MIKSTISFLLAIVVFTSCSPKLAPDENWAEGNWVLTELKGVPVQISGNVSRDAHIEFRPSSRKYEGFGGCNRINGTYNLNKSRIDFIPATGKLDACPDVPFENTFISLLDQVDRYTLHRNTLTFKDGRKVLIKLERK